MDLNSSKRKRSVPDWMKQSPSARTTDGKKSRPSYPPISIKKTKQAFKALESRLEPSESNSKGSSEASSADKMGNKSNQVRSPNNSFEFHSAFSGSESKPNGGSDDFCMTVEDLTRVAQEVINEERQRLNRTQFRSNKARPRNVPL